MRWKTKSRIQNAIARLPSSLSYDAYFWVQRRFGALRTINPVSRFEGAVGTWRRIQELGQDPRDRVFFEIGTGRVPNVPMAYWLMGAGSTVTVDLNPYMRLELVKDSLKYVAENEAQVLPVFGDLLDSSRYEQLLRLNETNDLSLEAFLDACQIRYIAPGDAADTGLEDACIDFHTSYTVLEHIPPGTLKSLLREGNRLIRHDGLFVHMIDYSDHFSHSDRSISAINFLQFSEEEWSRYAGNRYMYMNRLRHDDYLAIFDAAGHDIVFTEPTVDQSCVQMLRKGQFKLDERFREKPDSVLATTASWIVSRCNHHAES